jgi:asparagine synthetase B (glutamine-hydrolysing)
MCGIAGLFLKDRALEPDLGRLLAGMLKPLSDRGPDSAGFAVYGDEVAHHIKLTLRVSGGYDFGSLLRIVGPIKASPQLARRYCRACRSAS